MVADGGVLGVGVDQYQIGVETAKVVVKVLKGANPADTPITLANKRCCLCQRRKKQKIALQFQTVS